MGACTSCSACSESSDTTHANEGEKIGSIALLGPAASGKSTILRRLTGYRLNVSTIDIDQILYGMQSSLIRGMMQLIYHKQSNSSNSEYEGFLEAALAVMDVGAKLLNGRTLLSMDTKQIGIYIKLLWDQNFIKTAFKNRHGLFRMPDNFEYLVTKADVILDSDSVYHPNDQV